MNNNVIMDRSGGAFGNETDVNPPVVDPVLPIFDNLSRALPKHVQDMAKEGVPMVQWVVVLICLASMSYQLKKVLNMNPNMSKNSKSLKLKADKKSTKTSKSEEETTTTTTKALSSKKTTTKAASLKKSTQEMTASDDATNEENPINKNISRKRSKTKSRNKRRKNKGKRKRALAHKAVKWSRVRSRNASGKKDDYDIDAIVAMIEGTGKKVVEVHRPILQKRWAGHRLHKKGPVKHQLTSRKMKMKQRNRSLMNRRAKIARSSKGKINDDKFPLFAPTKNDETLNQNNVTKAVFNTSSLEIVKVKKSEDVEWTTVLKPETKLPGATNLSDENEDADFLNKIAEKVKKEIEKETQLDQKLNPFNLSSVAPSGEVTLAWKNISMNVSEKTILSNVCGQIHGGKTTALTGTSRQELVCLIDILSGKSKSLGPTTIKGELEYKGGIVDLANSDEAKSYGGNINKNGGIACITQNYFLQLSWTPRKAVHFASKLQFPRYLTSKQLDKLVDTIVHELELDDCADTKLKDLPLAKRMLTILGMELLKKPNMIFLDNPIRGLFDDSSIDDAKAFCNVLKNVSKKTGSTVLFSLFDNSDVASDNSINNVGEALFSSLADELLLINRGETVYNGAIADVSTKLGDCGYKNTENKKSFGFIMETLKTTPSDELKQSGFLLEF